VAALRSERDEQRITIGALQARLIAAQASQASLQQCLFELQQLFCQSLMGHSPDAAAMTLALQQALSAAAPPTSQQLALAASCGLLPPLSGGSIAQVPLLSAQSADATAATAPAAGRPGSPLAQGTVDLIRQASAARVLQPAHAVPSASSSEDELGSRAAQGPAAATSNKLPPPQLQLQSRQLALESLEQLLPVQRSQSSQPLLSSPFAPSFSPPNAVASAALAAVGLSSAVQGMHPANRAVGASAAVPAASEPVHHPAPFPLASSGAPAKVPQLQPLALPSSHLPQATQPEVPVPLTVVPATGKAPLSGAPPSPDEPATGVLPLAPLLPTISRPLASLSGPQAVALTAAAGSSVTADAAAVQPANMLELLCSVAHSHDADVGYTTPPYSQDDASSTASSKDGREAAHAREGPPSTEPAAAELGVANDLLSRALAGSLGAAGSLARIRQQSSLASGAKRPPAADGIGNQIEWCKRPRVR